MRAFVKDCIKKITILSASLLILFALFLTLARLTANYLNASKPLVLQAAASILHQAVQIDKFSINWAGVQPEIVLQGVTLGSLQRHELVTIKELRFTVDLWRSLWHRTFVPGAILLQGAHFALQQQKDGHWLLQGFDRFNQMSQSDIDLVQSLSWLAQEKYVAIDDVDVDIAFHAQQTFLIKQFHLQVKNHVIAAVGAVEDNKKLHPFRFVLRPIKLNNANKFSAAFYFKAPLLKFTKSLDQLSLAQFTPAFTVKNFAVQAEIWGKLQNGQLTEVRGTVWNSNFQLLHPQHAKIMHVDKVHSNFYWQRLSGGWRLFLDRCNAWIDDKVSQTQQIVLLKDGHTTAVHLDQLDIGTGERIFKFLGNWRAEIDRWLTNSSLHVNLSDISFYTTNSAENPAYSLQAKFSDLKTKAYGKFPGLDQVTGQIWLSPQSGMVLFKSQHAKIDYPYLFAVPITDMQSDLVVMWKKQANSWHWAIPSLYFTNRNLNFFGQLNHWENQLTFSGIFSARNVGQLSGYVPRTVISAELQQWLKQAFQDGEVHNGSVQFFYDNLKPHFSLNLQVKELQLRFAEAWPAITGLSGNLCFDDQRMRIITQGGEISGNSLQNIAVEIPNLHHPNLLLSGTATGNIKTGLNFLQQSPLELKHGFSDWGGSGNIALKLNLQKNLEKPEKDALFKGELTFQNDDLFPPVNFLKITKVFGNLNFANNHFLAEDLQTTIQNNSYLTKIHSQLTRRGKMKLDISLNEKVAQNDLKKRAKNINFGILLGESATEIVLANKTTQGKITMPFNKSAVWTANFDKFEFNLAPDQEQQIDRDPRSLPDIDFSCKSCRFNQHDVGAVSMQLRKIPLGVRISKLTVENPIFSLQTTGTWLCLLKNCHTKIEGSITHQHLDTFLHEYDITTGLIGGIGKMNFELSWLGGPEKFSWRHVAGDLAFHYVDGRIVKLSNTTESKLGLGRFLNLLSLQSLPENIFSGFRHLNAKGFEFDNFTGKVNIHQGVGYAKNVEILGPIAWVKINGAVNFVGKKYDLTMHVVPNMTSSLPVIIGIATGPLAGAISWLVNAVVAPKIGAIAAKEYRVRGTMVEPVFAKNEKSDLAQ